MLLDRLIILFRSLQKPVITIVLGVVIAADIWSLDDRSYAKYAMGLSSGWAWNCFDYPDAYIIEDGDSFRLIEGNFGKNPPTSGVLGEVWYYSTNMKQGFWALTEIHHSAYFNITTKKPLTTKQNSEVICQFSDMLIQEPWESQECISLAQQGGGESTTILWFGYLHNTAALFLGCLLLISLPHRIRERRRNTLIAMKLCPKCRYDLRESVEVCPECGASISIHHGQESTVSP